MNERQNKLLRELGLPTEFDGLDDDAMIAIEDALSDEMRLHGINAKGDGLNERGELCRSVLVALPDE